MRPVRSVVLGFFTILCAVAAAAGVPAAVAETGLYVDIRASDDADAPVVERWKLYGASYALVIGIDNYTGGWPRLSNAIKDARLVAEALERRGFEVELLIDVTGDDLRKGLRRFFAYKGSDPTARLFVWFAGHGYTEFGEGYLVPADAPPPGSPDFAFSALHMGDVGSMVRIAKSKHVLAVFDSCFAGTIFSSQRARPPAAITEAVKRPVRQFLTSGDADQKVSDDGLFRNLFLRALRGDETADANRDGYLTGTELSFYLEDRMINLTQAAQTPRGGKLRDPRFDQGDFVFLLPNQAPQTAAVPKTAAPEATTATSTFVGPSEAALDLEFWDAVKTSDDLADYQAYLEAFPKGRFAPLARARLQRPEPAPAPEPLQDASLPETTASEPSSLTGSQAAVLSADRFNGRWVGVGKTGRNSPGRKCGSGPKIDIKVRNGEISGTIFLSVAHWGATTGFVRYTGTINGEGRFKGRGPGMVIEGSIDGDGETVSGTWSFPNKPCQGEFKFSRSGY